MLLLLSAACKVDAAEVCTLQRVEEPLLGGSSHAALIGLSDEAEAAVGSLSFTLENGEVDHCTLSRIAQNWGLTAKHCGASLWTQAVLQFGHEAVVLSPSELTLVEHPERDVALITWDPETVADGPTLAWSAPKQALIDIRMQVAGSGLDDQGSVGEVSFGVAEIEDARETQVLTRIIGIGPCFGDSGGPMLTRGVNGEALVLGVLSEGSPTCSGGDVYERVDVLDDWIGANVGAPPDSDRSCGNVTSEGFCFGGSALWCRKHKMVTIDCSDSACGWDASAAGYRCVAPEADPCHGVSELGECREQSATRCVQGVLLALDCGECGGSCQVSERTGYASCEESRGP